MKTEEKIIVPPTLLARLFSILEKQIQLSDELLLIIDEEKEALMSLEIQRVSRVSAKKINQLNRIQQFDKALWETAEMLFRQGIEHTPQSSQFNSGPDNKIVHLSRIMPLLTADDRNRLAGLKERLVSGRERIAEQNLQNKRFIQDTLGYLGDAVSLITSAIAGSSYGMSGNARQQKVAGPAFISKEV